MFQAQAVNEEPETGEREKNYEIRGEWVGEPFVGSKFLQELWFFLVF
jgi:hypothetical protein